MNKIVNRIKSKIQGLFSLKKNIDENYIPSSFEMYLFYFSYIKLNWLIIVFNYVRQIAQSLMMVKLPFVFLDIKNSLMKKDDNQLFYSVIELVTYKVLIIALNFLEQSYFRANGNQLCEKIQLQMFKQVISLDISYFEDHKPVEILEIINNSSDQINFDMRYSQVIMNFQMYFMFAGQIYFILAYSPRILVSMVIISLIGSFVKSYYQRMYNQVNEKQDKEGQFKKILLSDILNNIFLVKTFRTEEKEVNTMAKINNKIDSNQDKLTYYSTLQQMSFSIITQAISAVIFINVVMIKFNFPERSQEIAIGLGEVITYSYAVTKLTDDIVHFFNREKNQESPNTHVAKTIGKVMHLLSQTPQIPTDFNKTRDHSQLSGNIRFENVYFRYPKARDTYTLINQQVRETTGNSNEESQSQNKLLDGTLNNNSIQGSSNELILSKQQSERDYVLNNITFEIKSGQFVAFVGMSGSGKSTITKIIQRFYDADSGYILYDNQNIKDIQTSKLRRSIGIVTQEPTLFDNDIEYNITYGCQQGEYTQEELKQICEVSGVSEFAFDKDRFPEGLQTLVGTKGVKLSGGQKQRVAIARALIKKPSILILDEATSSLDAESEHIVQKYIDQLVEKRGMTIIVIAHRLSTIIKSDVIYVMDKGIIQESGTHSQLIEKNGAYKKLIHHQISISDELHDS